MRTMKDAYPIPRIDRILSNLANARYFASLDPLMGYYEKKIEPADRVKTAFTTHRG